MPVSYSPETRQDRITKQWVLFAPSRRSRPKRTTTQSSTNPDDERPVEGCPFCPGHEDQIPQILWQLDASNYRPWKTRVLPNKYPALDPDRTSASPPPSSTLYDTQPSRGRQEVIVETPFHHRSLAQMSVSEVEAVLQTYLHRYHSVRRRDDDLIPFLFRNHGARAGASIAHPHSQLIASPLRPPSIEREEHEARTRFDEIGNCPYCKMIDVELNEEDRLVWTNDRYVVFVPFAAQVPFELWILPREHDPEFGNLEDRSLQPLAEVLRTALYRLRRAVGNPAYNLFVRTALDYNADAPHLHWSLRIRPQTTVQAGFEVATGLHITPSIPERDAALLRQE